MTMMVKETQVFDSFPFQSQVSLAHKGLEHQDKFSVVSKQPNMPLLNSSVLGRLPLGREDERKIQASNLRDDSSSRNDGTALFRTQPSPVNGNHDSSNKESLIGKEADLLAAKKPDSSQPIVKRPKGIRSAYSLFFKDQRRQILESCINEKLQKGEEVNFKIDCPTTTKGSRPHRKTHGMIGFEDLAKTVSQRWKEASQEVRDHYKDLSRKDSLRFHEEKKQFQEANNGISLTPPKKSVKRKQGTSFGTSKKARMSDDGSSKTAKGVAGKGTRKLTGVRTAYNLFFRDQRRLILKSIIAKKIENGEEVNFNMDFLEPKSGPRPHRKTHGIIGFQELAKMIAQRWKDATKETREHYKKLSLEDSARYQEERKEILLDQAMKEKAEADAVQKANAASTPKAAPTELSTGPGKNSQARLATTTNSQVFDESMKSQLNTLPSLRNDVPFPPSLLNNGLNLNNGPSLPGQHFLQDGRFTGTGGPLNDVASTLLSLSRTGQEENGSFQNHLLNSSLPPSVLHGLHASGNHLWPQSQTQLPQLNNFASQEDNQALAQYMKLKRFVRLFTLMELKFFPSASLADISNSLKNKFGLVLTPSEIKSFIFSPSSRGKEPDAGNIQGQQL